MPARSMIEAGPEAAGGVGSSSFVCRHDRLENKSTIEVEYTKT